MELTKFIEKAFYRRIDFQYNNNWTLIYLLRHATSFIDFGCNKCRITDIRRCCANCSRFVGHHHVIRSSLKVVKYYAKVFKEKNGFWTPEGCVLPRHLRSNICVKHYCYEKGKFSKDDTIILNGFSTDNPHSDMLQGFVERYLIERMGEESFRNLQKELSSEDKITT